MPWWLWIIIILVALMPFQKQIEAATKRIEEKNKANAKGTSPPPEKAVASTDAVYFHWPALGGYEYSIVGTSFYQEALQKIAGDHPGEMARVHTVACLVPDAKNPYDDKAVRVDINGITVGHLEREDARSFRRRLGAKKIGPNPTTCNAEVWGGNVDRHGKEWGYGVKLDIKPLGGW